MSQRFFIFLSFYFFIFPNTYAQNDVNAQINPINWYSKTHVDSLLANTKNKSEIYQSASNFFIENRNYDLALEHLLDAYEWSKMRGDVHELNLIEFHLAELYYFNENPSEALGFALKSRNVFDKNNLDSLKFESNYLISQIYLDQNKVQFSKDYTQEVFDYGISAKSELFLGKSYLLSAKYEMKKGDLVKSKNFLGIAMRSFKKVGDVEYMAETYFLFGINSLQQNKHKQAKGYFEQCYKNLSLLKNDYKKVGVLLKMGEIEEELGQKLIGIKRYKQALKIAQDNQFAILTIQVTKELMRTSLELKENSKAREYLDLHNHLSDSILAIDAQNNIINKTAERQLKSKNKAIENYKSALETSDRIVYGSIFIVVLLILVLFLLFYNYKRRKQMVIQEKDLLQAKQDLSVAELNQAKKALESNNENLRAITNLLIEKNVQIKTLLEQIEMLKEHNSFSSLSDDKVRKVNDLLEFKILTEDDWQEFRKLYNQVYEGVQAKLKIDHPNLTKSEVKLFMISKLNLSLEEAAGLLAISPESVRKARYRLKKKLDLGDQDLQKYIVDF